MPAKKRIGKRESRCGPQVGGGSKRVSFAARGGVASDFPAPRIHRPIQGFTFAAVVLLIRPPNARNAQVVELVDTHV